MTGISFPIKILPFLKKEKQKMAELICVWCNSRRELDYVLRFRIQGEGSDVIRGVLECRACHKKTVFGMRENAISFYPGKDLLGELHTSVPDDAKDCYSEAVLAFHGAAYRSAVSMARASLEQSLVKKGVKEDRLEMMIDSAFTSKLITQEQQMLAHGSRLVGNSALHRAKTIEPVEAQAALSASVQLSNHLFP